MTDESPNATPTAAEINAAADAAVKSGTAVSMGAAAGVIVDPPKPAAHEDRLAALEARVEKLEREFVAALENLAHVMSEDFKKVWAKVTAFMPFKVK